MKTGHNRQLFHRQLFRRLLVAEASRAFDLGWRSQVFRTSESLQTVLQRCGNRPRARVGRHDFRAGRRAEVQWNVPKWIYSRWDTTEMTRNKTVAASIKNKTRDWSIYWQAWQTTSDCKPPVKIWSMMQLHRLTVLFSWGWIDCCSFGPLRTNNTNFYNGTLLKAKVLFFFFTCNVDGEHPKWQ